MRSATRVALCALWLSGPLAAQASIWVEGRVTDDHGVPVAQAQVVFTDGEVPALKFTGLTNVEGRYRILLTESEDIATAVQDEGDAAVPREVELRQNYPNPFNPSTVIPYRLSRASLVRLGIYNVLGQPVRSLVQTYQEPGEYQVLWDGRDDQGAGVAAGAYIYRLETADFAQSRKMVRVDGAVVGVGSGSGSMPRPAARPAQAQVPHPYTVTITGEGILSFLRQGVMVGEERVFDFVVDRPQAEQTAVVQAAVGGRVEAEDGAALVIPAGVLEQDVKVTVASSAEAVSAPDPAEVTRVSQVYDFAAGQEVFAEPVAVVLPYDETRLPAGVDEKELFAASWNGANWERQGGTVDTVADQIVVETQHLSFWGVFGGEEPEMELTVDPERYNALGGDDLKDLTFQVTVKGVDLAGIEVSIVFQIITFEGGVAGNIYNATMPLILDDNGGKGATAQATQRDLLARTLFDFTSESRDPTRAGDGVYGGRIPGESLQDEQTVEEIHVTARVQYRGGGSIVHTEERVVYVFNKSNEVALRLDLPAENSEVGAEPTFTWGTRFTEWVLGNRFDTESLNQTFLYIDGDDQPFGLLDFIGLGDRIKIDVSGQTSYQLTSPLPPGEYWWGIEAFHTSTKGKEYEKRSDPPRRFVVKEETGGSEVPGRPIKTLTVDLPGGAQMEMVWIEPGTFTMGDSELGFTPHPVTLSKGFWLGKYELTQGQWQAVIGMQPWSGQSYVQANPNNPAVYISWDDLQVFVHQLNLAAGDSLYRLPTEAEWEYACRAGTTTWWSFGDEESQLKEYAWYYDNAWNAGLQYAQPVGTKLPNLWGLYDMHGNVWEWVQDWYGDYPSSSQTDPTGPAAGSIRVGRGGYFLNSYARTMRSAYRDANSPDRRFSYIGARLLRMETAVPTNQPPKADAGPDQDVASGNPVTLNSSGSSDPDNNPLTYTWTQAAGPSVSLSDPAAAQPNFTPREAGTYVFSLVVNDGKVDSAPDEVSVMVEAVVPGTGTGAPGQPATVLAITSIQPSDAAEGWYWVLVSDFGREDLAEVQLFIDGGSAIEMVPTQTGNWKYHWNATGVAQGEHTFRLKAWDKSLNDIGEVRYTVTKSVAEMAFAAVGGAGVPSGGGGSTGKTLTVDLPGGESMEFVWIEPGTFTMGSPDSENPADDSDKPQHKVTISKGFYLGKFEITQAQWEAVMGTRPWSGQGYVQENPRNPAVFISWDDMQGLVHKLNQAAGDSLYRLPSEAEWEYACRAGTTTPWSFGEDESQLGNYAWYEANAWYVGERYAHQVGTKQPNSWGLYDMPGNVWEWVQDWYGNYSSSAQTDPTGPASGSDRVVRGGTFFAAYPRYTRSASRTFIQPGYRSHVFGARLLRMETAIPTNQPPKADAGPDQQVAAGNSVTLNGSGSSGPDNNPLTFRWAQKSGPTVNLSDPAAAQPTFTPREAGTYVFSLVVNDGKTDSAPDEVVVTVAAETATRELVLQPDGATGKDVFVGYDQAGEAQTKRYYEFSSLYAGASFPGSNYTKNTKFRTYLEFALAGVPADAQIQSATLSLYCDWVDNPTEVTLDLYQVTGAWQENNLTWNNTPGDAGTVVTSTRVAGKDQWYTWDLTSLVQGWRSGSANYGLMLRERNEGFNQFGVKRFVASEEAEAMRRPKLTITYQAGGNEVLYRGLAGYGLSNHLIIDTRGLPPVALSGYGLSRHLVLDTRRGWTGMAESPVFTIDLRD